MLIHVTWGWESSVKKSSKRTSAEFPFTGNAVRGSQQGYKWIAYNITGFSGIHTKTHTAGTHSKLIVIIVIDIIMFAICKTLCKI